MFVLGLTGSIGMGKSTTAKLFAEEGVPVHDADAAVHRLYEGEAVPLIEAAFPGTTAAGKVDRDSSASACSAMPRRSSSSRQIVHPLVRAAEERFLAEAERRAARKVAVLDIPLLFETGGDARCDAVVVVRRRRRCSARALERPGMTRRSSQAILAQQMPDAEKRAPRRFRRG